jgi:cytochrome c553
MRAGGFNLWRHSMRSTRQALAVLALGVMACAAVRAQDVATDSETVRRAVHVCASCHGDGGQSKKAGIPSLAGQMRQYTIAQLKDFRSSTRAETGTLAYMWGVSALLDDAAITGLADFYATQAPAPGKPAKPALLAAGKKVFTAGAPSRGMRACASCHGDSGEGASGFPRLAGQRAEYVYAQLKVFGTTLRPHGVLMKGETRAMTSAEMRAVAAYVQSL